MTSSNSREMKQKLSGFKTEVANSMNISLNQGYNGDISARDAGRIGGQMVKRMIEKPVKYSRHSARCGYDARASINSSVLL